MAAWDQDSGGFADQQKQAQADRDAALQAKLNGLPDNARNYFGGALADDADKHRNDPTPGLYKWNGDTGEQFRARGDAYGNRANPTADMGLANQDYGRQGEDRAGQYKLLGQLQEQAEGRGPSLATMQFNQSNDAAIQAQMAMAHSANPMNAGMANYNAAQQGGMMQMQAVRGSAMARMQEQLSARQQLAGVLGQTRDQDLSARGQSQSQGFGLADLALRGRGQNDAMQQAYLNAELEAERQRQAGGISYGNTAAGVGMTQAQLAAQLAAQQQARADQNRSAAIGAGATLAGAAAMASDRRLKRNVSDGDREVRSMLAELSPKTFDYRDPESFGRGRHLGIMAQDLEKSRLGASLVRDTPRGKMIDVSRATGSLLAAVASLNKRVERVERSEPGQLGSLYRKKSDTPRENVEPSPHGSLWACVAR